MKNIVGIDFGHGETSAGLVISDNIQGHEINMQDLNIIGEKTKIPSVVCIMQGGEIVINPSDNQIAKSKDFGISFKDPLIGNEKYHEISESNKTFFKLFLSNAYKAIEKNPNNPLHISSNNGERDFLVYIACPSGWDENQKKAYRDFVSAECGISVVDIVKESRAAYIAARRTVSGGIRTQGGNVLVIDFGSSTIDFTYFNNDTKFEPVHAGYKLGARRIEEDILNYLEGNEPKAKEEISLWKQICGSEKGKDILLFEIRKQKEVYFEADNPDDFPLSLDFSKMLVDKSLRGHYIEPEREGGYTKNDVLHILSNYIGELDDMLDDFLTKDGVSSVDKVILTGGASRMFFFRDLVSKKYNVSKDDDTLIIDLDSSYTISRGIAAFGFMNEKATTKEKPLWERVNEFIENELPDLLRKSLNKAVSDIYYDEYTKITARYKKGEITDSSGRHNLDSLEDAFIAFLNSYSTSPESVGTKIAKAVEDKVGKAINTQLKEYTEVFGFKTDEINVTFDFDETYYLPVETAQGTINFMWKKVFEYIENRDFFGTTSNTPYRDRDYSDRNSIVTNLNSNLRKKCDALHYDGDLESEQSAIAESIRSKIQEIIDNAKLEMYK